MALRFIPCWLILLFLGLGRQMVVQGHGEARLLTSQQPEGSSDKGRGSEPSISSEADTPYNPPPGTYSLQLTHLLKFLPPPKIVSPTEVLWRG